jgi:hypothetical protein
VVELAKAMGRFPSVARVDLLTRLICDPSVDKSYGVPEERLQLPGPPGEAKPTASALGTPLPSGDYGAGGLCDMGSCVRSCAPFYAGPELAAFPSMCMHPSLS